MTKPKGPVGESDRTLRARQTPAKPGTLQSPVAAPEAPPTATRNPAAATFAEPSVPAQQPAAASSAAAAAYVPKKVPVPRSAKNKGVPGPVPMKDPDWTSRQHRRYPPEAMTEAVEMLKPANTPEKLKGKSIYATKDVIRIAGSVSEKFSNAEKGIVCVIDPKALLKHAEAHDAGVVIAPPGRDAAIPQVVIDNWAGWITMDAQDQRSPPITQALWMLWQLCDAAGVEVPTAWAANGPPKEFWLKLSRAKVDTGYGYPDLKGRMSETLDTARRNGENPVRILQYYERVEKQMREELDEMYGEWELTFEVMRDQIKRWWMYDEKGMVQDLGQQGGELSLGPVWLQRGHTNSTGNRNWFTIVKFLHADGLGAPCDINIEMGRLTKECYDAAPGHLIGTSKTGMQNSERNLTSIENFMRNRRR